LKGELVVDIDPSLFELAVAGAEVRLEKSPREVLDSQITAARTSGHRMVWAVATLTDRTAAEAWAGAAVLVKRAALPATEEDEYFDFELLGAAVVDTAGAPLGVVREIVATAANDVMIAQGPRGEVLIPVTRVAILEVDRAGKRIVVAGDALVYEDGRESS